MTFQVLVLYGSREEKVIDVASSCEEFNNTTIREIKDKFIASTPGVSGPDRIRVVLECRQLEDDKTLGFYNIEHSAVLIFVKRMPGGGDGKPPEFPRSESMERLSFSM